MFAEIDTALGMIALTGKLVLNCLEGLPGYLELVTELGVPTLTTLQRLDRHQEVIG